MRRSSEEMCSRTTGGTRSFSAQVRNSNESADRHAEIIYVPAEDVLRTAAATGGHSFDAPGADFHHRPAPGGGECCTFESLIAEHDLAGDQALARLAKIVHAADIAADLDTDPLGPGLLAIGLGGLDVDADDQVLLQRGMFVYDAFTPGALARSRLRYDRSAGESAGHRKPARRLPFGGQLRGTETVSPLSTSTLPASMTRSPRNPGPS
jgi:hypothetical protein